MGEWSRPCTFLAVARDQSSYWMSSHCLRTHRRRKEMAIWLAIIVSGNWKDHEESTALLTTTAHIDTRPGE